MRGRLRYPAVPLYHVLPPLDMPMDPESPVSPEDIVNHGSEAELSDLIYKWRKERHSHRMARALMKARPIRTTTEMAQVVTRAIPSRSGLHHLYPAPIP